MDALLPKANRYALAERRQPIVRDRGHEAVRACVKVDVARTAEPFDQYNTSLQRLARCTRLVVGRFDAQVFRTDSHGDSL